MEVRIVPMSFNDPSFIGKTIEEVQKEFFMDYLINIEKGWYYYAKTGLDANTGDLILFQMDNQIIASAYLQEVINFNKPTIDGNGGAYVLEQKTIKIFKPIIGDELENIICGFKKFNQTKQKYLEKEVNMEILNKRMNVNA